MPHPKRELLERYQVFIERDAESEVDQAQMLSGQPKVGALWFRGETIGGLKT